MARVQLRSAIGERIAQLSPSQKKLIDSVYRRLPIPPNWVYKADGLATIHHSPFLEDAEWSRLYDQMAAGWYRDEVLDVRWRMWLFTRFALQARPLPGNFAEFGTYRGGCAWMLLQTADLEPTRRLHLFDTFEGIPDDRLTDRERAHNFAHRLSDTSVDYVAQLLRAWNPIAQLHAGDVFETVPSVDTGPLAFVHIDLNASAPTLHVLEHSYERLVPGAIVLFDDYGASEYVDQRRLIDAFMRGRPDVLIALPTGQGVFAKAP